MFTEFDRAKYRRKEKIAKLTVARTEIDDSFGRRSIEIDFADHSSSTETVISLNGEEL